jgi:hypothetical protein
LENAGFNGFSLKELINKIKKLRQKYKAEKDKSKRTGTARQKQWKYFGELDGILSQRHNVNPPFVIDSMSESNNENPDPGNAH